MVEAARGEPFRRRDNIQPDRTAEATMFEDRRLLLQKPASLVDAPQDQ
ncbi:hypothetical protein [Paenarthrobacter sp. NPDC089316]